jgi:hypothetical protein
VVIEEDEAARGGALCLTKTRMRGWLCGGEATRMGLTRHGLVRTRRFGEVDEDEDERRSGEVDEGTRAADLGDGEDEDVEVAASVRCVPMGELHGPAVMETMRIWVAVWLSGEWKRWKGEKKVRRVCRKNL